MTRPPHVRLGPRDFNWLTGGQTIGMWLNRRHRHLAKCRLSRTRGLSWSLADVSRLLDELWPDVEWPEIKIGLPRDLVARNPKQELRPALWRLLRTLTPQEMYVLAMRWGLVCRPMTRDEISGTLRRRYRCPGPNTLTRERIRQIEIEALWKMRQPSRIRFLQAHIGRAP